MNPKSELPNTSGTLIEVHETFKHDCSDFPEEFNRYPLFYPKGGDEKDGLYRVPSEIAEYFIRAGWASKPGEQPEKPPEGRPVYVNLHDGKLDQKS